MEKKSDMKPGSRVIWYTSNEGSGTPANPGKVYATVLEVTPRTLLIQTEKGNKRVRPESCMVMEGI